LSVDDVVLEGIDVSSRIVAEQLVKIPAFVYFKATDGVGSPSSTILSSAIACRSRGITKLGAYHFLRVRHGRAQDADEQCKEFFDLRAATGTDSIEAWLDVEFGEENSSNRAATPDEVRAAIEMFWDAWHGLTTDVLDLYSSPGEAAAMGIVLIPGVDAYPLAKAAYGGTQTPIAPWKSTRFHQYQGTTPYTGVIGGADLTRCFGTL
jgi:GH25 family lysozyme M1 (1,4-beta-N-acetylmuramidase)